MVYLHPAKQGISVVRGKFINRFEVKKGRKKNFSKKHQKNIVGSKKGVHLQPLKQQ
jgi:hypothetical protein